VLALVPRRVDSIFVTGYTNATAAANANGKFDALSTGASGDTFLSQFAADGTKISTKLFASASANPWSEVVVPVPRQAGSIYITGGTASDNSSDAFLSKLSLDPALNWTKTLTGSADGKDQSSSLATGSDGSVYITGYTESSPLEGQGRIGGGDAFLSKFKADGTPLWTRVVGSTSTDRSNSVTVGPDGSAYITGVTYGSFDGQPSLGQGGDAFLSKFTADGVKLWTRIIGSAGSDASYSVTAGSDGAVYITGSTGATYTNNAVDVKPDAFLTRFNASGTKEWTTLIGASGNDQSYSVTTGPDGYVYITGYTDSPFVDGQANSGYQDAFLTKISSFDQETTVKAGDKIWTTLIGTSGTDYANSVTVGSDGGIYITVVSGGNLDGQNNSSNGGPSAFLLKFAADGTKTWTKLVGSIAEKWNVYDNSSNWSNPNLGKPQVTIDSGDTPVILLSTAQVIALSAAQLNALGAAGLMTSLSTAQVMALTTSQVGALGTSSVSALGQNQLASLSSAQLLALGSAQLNALQTAQMASLTTGQLVNLSTAQLTSLSTRSLNALTTAQFPALTTAQISSLGTSQVASLETQDLAALGSAQVRAITTAVLLRCAPTK